MNAPLHSSTVGAVSIVAGKNPMSDLLRLDSRNDFERFARHHTGWREDAGLTIAFARQLETIIAKVYAAEFAQYRATEFFPVSTEVAPGALSFTYRMLARIGNAQVINAGNAKDLPNIDLEGEEWPTQVITLGAAYNFTVIDQASAAMMQIAIEAEKAKATREAITALEEQIWCIGYAPAGINGVTNAPGVAAVLQASTGTWSSQLKTALATAPATTVPYPGVGAVSAISADIIAMKQQIFTKTLGRHRATHCLLPPNLYAMLDTAPQSPAFTSKTFLTMLEELTGLTFDYWPILQTVGSIAGGSGTAIGSNDAFPTRVVVYEKNPEVVQLMYAQPFIQLAPQPVGLVWEVPCYSRMGGAMAVRPLGLVYMDGVAENVTGQDLDAFYAGREAGVVGSAPCSSEVDELMARAY